MAVLEEFIATIPNRLLLAAFVLILGTILGIVAGKINRRLLTRAGVPDAVEGTAFERSMRGFGTSTVTVVAKLSMWFIIGVAVLAALSVLDVRYTQQFWAGVTGFLPPLFVAILVLIAGVVVADKIELVIRERLRGIKLPQAGILPRIVKYTVVYIAALVALGQVGVATNALILLLAVYFFGIVFVGGIALQDLLASAVAGMYLLLTQPYGIGDQIRIGDREGIVQEVTTFVTHVESNDEEYVVPNRLVFKEGVVRIRRD